MTKIQISSRAQRPNGCCAPRPVVTMLPDGGTTYFAPFHAAAALELSRALEGDNTITDHEVRESRFALEQAKDAIERQLGKINRKGV